MKTRRGFTLVELLVVIAIIGILVGLLLPAIGMMQERARNMQCSNNVRQLALAALQYETSKGYLPGYVQKFGVFPGGVADPTDPGNFSGNVPRHVKVGGYGVALLAFLDAQGTYEHWIEDRYPVISDSAGEYRASSRLSGTGFHALAAPNAAVFQCPSNPNRDGTHGLNSYCPNNGMSHLRNTSGGPVQIVNFAVAESRNNGVFNAKYVGTGGAPTNNCGAQPGPNVTLDDIKDGKASTMLFGENAQAMPWHRPGFLNAGGLSSAGDDIASSEALLRAKFTSGMVWHYEDRNPASMPAIAANSPCSLAATSCNPVQRDHKINGGGKTGNQGIFTRQMSAARCVDLARPSSAHVDGFNAGFADGATRFVSSSIDYRAYQALLTPRGKGSSVPFPEFVLTDEIAQ
jgi:prepilin-type N-terminal cleavage/methylation domain-containing protein